MQTKDNQSPSFEKLYLFLLGKVYEIFRNTMEKENYKDRIVGLSDGIFALAIAILLIASNVPTNFEELMAFVYDIPPFGICIIFIYWIWTEQKKVFQSYNIFDSKMNLLNMLLLFFVLIYVYPLKFLMKWIVTFFSSLLGGTIQTDYINLQAMIPMAKLPHLMVIYSIGFICIFSCLFLMHQHGLSKKQELDLSPLQLLQANFSKNQLFYTVVVGILSFLCAIVGVILDAPNTSFFSGIVYNLLWVSSIFNIKKYKRQLAELEELEHA